MRITRYSFAILVCVVASVGNAQAQMKAHFINVGQADSILLEFKTAAILIDAGGETTGDDRDLDHLIGYWNDFFNRRTDLNRTIHTIIISHPHLDHTKHLIDVMQNFTVSNFVDGGGSTGSGISQVNRARQFAADNDITYEEVPDEIIDNRGYTTSALRALRKSPSKVDIKFLAGYRGCDNENNDSLAVLVTYKKASFLFSGYAESEKDRICDPEISHLLNRFRNTSQLDVDVYKVGHHDSRNGTTGEFLQAISPEMSLISAGHHSTRQPGIFHAFYFGHPRKVTVDLLGELTSGERETPATIYTMNGVEDIEENRTMERQSTARAGMEMWLSQ